MNKQLGIGIGIIVILGLGAWALLGKTAPANAQDPKAVTEHFYAAYKECLKNPPKAAEGKVSVYCQENTGYTTAAFSANLKQGGTAARGADPIACAQNIPYNEQVSDPTLYGDSNAQVVVQEFFAGPRVDIRVKLVKENGLWKVDNVLCPEQESSGTPTSADNAPPGSIHNLPVPPAVAAVRAYVAQKTGVDAGLVIIMTAYEKEWTDSCLGLGGPAESCLQAMTPGWEVSAQAKGNITTYRTNSDGSVIRKQP